MPWFEHQTLCSPIPRAPRKVTVKFFDFNGQMVQPQHRLLELGIRVLPRRRSGRHPWAVGSGFDTGKHIELFYWKTSVFAGKTTSLVRGDLPGGSPSGSPLGSSVPGQRVLGRETG